MKYLNHKTPFKKGAGEVHVLYDSTVMYFIFFFFGYAMKLLQIVPESLKVLIQ